MKSPKNKSQLYPRAPTSQGGYTKVIVIFLAPSPDKQVKQKEEDNYPCFRDEWTIASKKWVLTVWKKNKTKPKKLTKKPNPRAKQTFAKQSKYCRWIKPHPSADLLFPLSLTSEHKSKGEIKTFHKQKILKVDQGRATKE